MSKLLVVLWLLISVLLFVYSYGFVDLNLTLSAHPLVFGFVTWMQHLVYFDRNFSMKVFIALIVLLFICYFSTLAFWPKKNRRFPWLFVIVLAALCALAYPMLSSDVFKYLFGAKQILLYHANPYVVTPNTFENDTWIRFMRWVHTTTPYGPIFTLSTIPYYLVALGKFVPMLYLFKIGNLAWYLLAVWLIGKLGTTRAQLFFALNPLILMEWLINAHNDAIMITLLLLSLYLLTLKKRIGAVVALALSVGIKYVTVIFLPFIFFKKIPLQIMLYSVLSILAVIPLVYHYSWQYQPWYVTWLIPLAALVPSRTIRVTVLAYSFSVFSRYLYFVGSGSWLGTPLEHALMTFALPILVLGYNGLHAVVSQAQKTRVVSPH